MWVIIPRRSISVANDESPEPAIGPFVDAQEADDYRRWAFGPNANSFLVRRVNRPERQDPDWPHERFPVHPQVSSWRAMAYDIERAMEEGNQMRAAMLVVRLKQSLASANRASPRSLARSGEDHTGAT